MCRTLIVEDSAPFREAFRKALTRRFPAMVIEEAVDGAEALRRVMVRPPDIVIMDIRLPGENGLTVTGHIKSRWPGVTVIILTDYDLPEYREAALHNGADAFIPKGTLNLTELAQLVEKIDCAKTR